MTIPHVGPAVEAHDVGEAEELMRSRGMRISTARRAVLEALFDSEEPLSAEQIEASLADEAAAADLTSVYRNLEALESVGLVRHFHLGHGPGLYALATRNREYLLCESCGAVEAVDPERLDPIRDEIRKRFGFEARFMHFPIVGACPQCKPAITTAASTTEMLDRGPLAKEA